MKRILPLTIGFLLALGLAAYIANSLFKRSGATERPELVHLDLAAVHSQGRIKSFKSHAVDIVRTIAGDDELLGLPADAAYLDLMIQPDNYINQATVYVKKDPVRQQIATALRNDNVASDEQIETLLETGMIAPEFLFQPAASATMERMSQNLITTSKAVRAIERSIALQNPQVLADRLRLVPPPIEAGDVPWISISEIMTGTGRAELLDDSTIQNLRFSWASVEDAWRNDDRSSIGQSLDAFLAIAQSIAPERYPSTEQMKFESWYFRLVHLTWIWVIYLLALVPLLMAIAYKWDGARYLGMGMFAASFLLHTLALSWRWWVSGRWPNSNMFEAVTTSVWLAAACAVVIELFARKTPLRNVFILGASAASMTAMMAATYIPELDPGINNMMPILHDLWLYIHTNVIIASYALIAMAAALGILYLIRRIFTGSASDYAKAGGASLVLNTNAKGKGPNLGMVLDGATMVLIELSFLLLWAGIVMGAIWADHSWGRPWAWDPKEVFSLNTFIVFIVLIHVRLKARDKGIWTAILAIIGAGVMLFNWIVINFVIAGLHSYA